MIRPNRALRARCRVAAMSLVLTACGGDDDERRRADSASDTETSAPRRRATARSPSARCSRRPVTSPSSARPSSPASTSRSRTSTPPAASSARTSSTVKADSGDGTTDIAAPRSTSCSANDVDAIIGAASSGVSVTVIDKITGAGVVQFSPANTAAGFDTYDDNGLYFRTAPSDRPAGPGPRRPRGRGRRRERRHHGSPGLLRRGPRRAGRRRRSRRRAPRSPSTSLYTRTRELHRRGQQDRGGQARRHRADRVRGDHEDHPAADRQGHRPAGRRRSTSWTATLADYSTTREVRPDRRQGHPPGAGRARPDASTTQLQDDRPAS